MSFKIKGETSVEKGLGFPRHTTVSRLAYTPSEEGYFVYDTDLNGLFYWDGAAWNNAIANVPVNPPTLEYINVYLSANTVTNVGAPIIFDSVLSGSIPYNTGTGQFTLTNGTTYMIRANINIAVDGNLGSVWWDTTADVPISPSHSTVSARRNNALGSNQTEVIFTPTVDTVVELRNISSSARTIAGATFGNGSCASQAVIIALGTP